MLVLTHQLHHLLDGVPGRGDEPLRRVQHRLHGLLATGEGGGLAGDAGEELVHVVVRRGDGHADQADRSRLHRGDGDGEQLVLAEQVDELQQRLGRGQELALQLLALRILEVIDDANVNQISAQGHLSVSSCEYSWQTPPFNERQHYNIKIFKKQPCRSSSPVFDIAHKLFLAKLLKLC